ncbi:hypothetical protein YC2023_008514 [Brassica napus]
MMVRNAALEHLQTHSFLNKIWSGVGDVLRPNKNIEKKYDYFIVSGSPEQLCAVITFSSTPPFATLGNPRKAVMHLVQFRNISLTIENLVHARPPSCFSRRDKAVDTNHAAIGARTKPLEPPKILHPRVRETHTPPQSVGVTAHSGHAPPSPTVVCWSRPARPLSVRRREAAAAPSPPPVTFPVSHRPSSIAAGDSANSAESTR